ncbi:MAG: acyl--CoA ligase [bacterium]|nr:acyl--CoA ligase [bacterium]
MDIESPTLPALLAVRSATAGDAIAIVHDDASISYRELDARSREIAGRLVADGVGPHARVALLLENGIDWAVAAYGVARLGAVLVPLSTLLRPPELVAQLKQASVTHLIATPAYRGRDYVDELESVVPGVVTTTADGGRVPELPALQRVWKADALPTRTAPPEIVEALEAAVRPSHDFLILFTSGSRGAPKGVLHTHGNAIRAVASGLEARCIGRGERLYIPMPFFWTGGLAGGLLTALVAEATLLGESDPTPASTLALIARERVTLFRGWPDQATRIAADPAFAETDLSSLGGGSLPAILPEARRPRPGARANLFGMTETFGPYCGAAADRDLPEHARGSCGRPFDGIEVGILDLETGALAAPGEQGEIAVRGPNLMKGIVGRLREDTFTPDGYYRTGDLGLLDEDGYLFFKGRADDMFKVSGATVYPSEVEAALRSHPSVAQVFVTNVRDPETDRDVVGAAILCREVSDAAALDRLARERLSAFKVPKRWVQLTSLDEVPMMATGKVDKNGLQALIRSSGVSA